MLELLSEGTDYGIVNKRFIKIRFCVDAALTNSRIDFPLNTFLDDFMSNDFK